MRRGELAGLRWSDVDLERAQISVAQQRAKGAGTVSAGPTKTRRSRRLLPLDAVTADALRRHYKEQGVERQTWGEAYEDHRLVFCLENGRPLHPDAITSRLRRIARRLDLPWIKVHGLRHTYATLLLKAGVHPKVVQERLGHGSISITMDTYSHAIPSLQNEAADLGAAVIDGAGADQADAEGHKAELDEAGEEDA